MHAQVSQIMKEFAEQRTEMTPELLPMYGDPQFRQPCNLIIDFQRRTHALPSVHGAL